MKVALLADAEWLSQERGTLRRLIVGLADESASVVCVTPRSPDDRSDEPWMMSAESLWYAPSPWAWLRDRRVCALSEDLREEGVELVHALCASMEPAGTSLARTLGVPFVCSVTSQHEVSLLRPRRGGDRPEVFIAASEGLAIRVRERLGPRTNVECVPPGVYGVWPGSVARPLNRAEESLCFVVAGRGELDANYGALLEGLAAAKDRMSHAMFFFYSTGSDQQTIWSEAERLGLLDRVSMVPSGSDARGLMTQADVLLLPQPLRAVRTVVLEAMAAARPVIAVPDPASDHLIDGRTALVLDRPDAAAWASILSDLARQRLSLVELGLGAQRYILENHRASAFTTSIHGLYERLCGPVAIPIRA